MKLKQWVIPLIIFINLRRLGIYHNIGRRARNGKADNNRINTLSKF